MSAWTIDDLFALPLDQFIPGRPLWPRRCGPAGDAEEAAEVAATRKPSVAAWAVNEPAWSAQGATVGELFDAGDALRAARIVLSLVRATHHDPAGSRRTPRAQSVEALVKAAQGLLTSEARSSARP